MADEPKTPAGGLTPAGGVRPTPRIVGPVAPPVYTAGAKPGSARIVSETAEPLVTEGMKARQRHIEKKRRVVATLRAVKEEEAAERWGRGRTWIFYVDDAGIFRATEVVGDDLQPAFRWAVFSARIERNDQSRVRPLVHADHEVSGHRRSCERHPPMRQPPQHNLRIF